MSTICTRQQVITHKYNITEEKDTNLTPEQVFSTTITCHKQKEPKKLLQKRSAMPLLHLHFVITFLTEDELCDIWMQMCK